MNLRYYYRYNIYLSLIYFFVLERPRMISGFWWNVGNNMLYLDHKKICRAARTTGHKAHMELCSSHELIKEIMDGVKMGLQECGHQLRFHQWNCSQKYRSIGKMMTRSTKETAFVQAITSAGISFQVAQACRKGQISSCFCKHDKQRQTNAGAGQTYQWDGCDDNIDFGCRKSTAFLSVSKRNVRDTEAQISRHNYHVGCQAVKVLVTKKCKCHGLSGSCEISTCYKKVATFRSSADLLLEKFKNAEAVAPHNGGKLFRQINRHRAIKLRSNKYQRWYQNGRQYRKVRSSNSDDHLSTPKTIDDRIQNFKDVGNLVYTEQSPDFCVPNRSLGILSPVGRQCLATGASTVDSWGSCQKLCCGKRVVTVESSLVESCNCTFEYCCKVRCQSCKKKVFTHHCSNLDA